MLVQRKCKHIRKSHIEGCIECARDGSLRKERKDGYYKCNCPFFSESWVSKVKQWFSDHFYW